MALTGLWSNGICAASQSDAISLFAAQFPLIDQGVVYHVISIGPAATTGASITLYASPLNSALPIQTVARNIYFAACDPALAPVTLSDIFTMPAGPDVATVWGFAFVIPITLYLAAWAYGSLNAMFKHRPDDD